MDNQLLLVPVEENEDIFLYEITSTVADVSPGVANEWVVNGSTPKLLQEMGTHFEKKFPLVTKRPNLTVAWENGKELGDFTGSTLSIYLGLFIEMTRFVHHRTFKADWNSITITGNVSIHGETVELVKVYHIPQKFKGVQTYAQKHEGKHLFIYVSDKTEVEPRQYDNLTVKAYTSQDFLGAIIAELFESQFSDEQKTLFAKTDMEREWDYIATYVFEEMKQDALKKDWKGFFIHGEGESGKSAMAYQLARYLAAADRIYAPLWVKIETPELQEYIIKPRLIGDTLNNPFAAKEDPLTKYPLAAYIAKKIAKTLGIKWTIEDGILSLASILDRGNLLPYLLIVDNIELDRADEVMQAVKIILNNVKNKPPVILTSRFDEKDAGYSLRELGIKKKNDVDMSHKEVLALVDSLLREQKYEGSLALDKKEYDEFIDKLYGYFGSKPGIITQIVPLLSRQKLSDLIPHLLSMRDKGFQEKVNAVYKVILNELDDFTQAVFFAMLRMFTTKSVSSGFNDNEYEQRIAEWIYDSGWTYLDGTRPKLADIKEKLSSVLIKLIRSHLILRTDDGYGIKNFTLIKFVFEAELAGKVQPCGNSLRDMIFDNSFYIRVAGFVTSQDVDTIRRLLDGAGYGNNADDDMLFAAAIYSNNPNHIDLLLNEFGFDLNKQRQMNEKHLWKPIQYAAVYNSSPDILRRLIEKHTEKAIDWKVTDKNGLTLLHLAAAENSNPEIIAMLIDKGLDMYAVDSVYKNTPLEYAARNPNLAIIKKFKGKGAKLDRDFISGSTLIHHAVEEANLSVLKWLIEDEQGLDVNAAKKDGMSPLHAAVGVDNNVEVIDTLLRAGAKKDNMWSFLARRDYTTDLSPLHVAVQNNKTCDNIDFLIKKKATVDIRTRYGETPLHFAALANKNPEIITSLLKGEADIDAKMENGETPVYRACGNKDPQTAIILIKAGATLDDEVTWGTLFKWKDTARKCLKKRFKKHKDWPLIEAAINESDSRATRI